MVGLVTQVLDCPEQVRIYATTTSLPVATQLDVFKKSHTPAADSCW